MGGNIEEWLHGSDKFMESCMLLMNTWWYVDVLMVQGKENIELEMDYCPIYNL